MLSYEYLMSVVESKDHERAQIEADHQNTPIGWALCDGALVIYDVNDPPEWFKFEKDDDGNSVQLSAH